jgi:4-amino-4-deoxy-L-arabinose transferase-like glycosyltransferase
MAPYGIVYYVLIALGVALFGLQMWFGRILSIIAFAACVWAIGSIVKKLTSSKEAVWVACLFAIAMVPGHAWIGIMRSDLIALAFGLAAVGLALRLEPEQRLGWNRLSVILLLAVAAVFVKHTLVLPVGIVFLRLLQINKRREATVFVTMFVFLVTAVVLLLNYTSNGGYIWQHFVHARTLPFDYGGLPPFLFQLIVEPTSAIFVIALSVFIGLNLRSRGENVSIKAVVSPRSLVYLYLLLTIAGAIISSGRVGSNLNYFLEASFVASIVGGLIYDDLRQRALHRIALGLVVVITLGGAFQLIRNGRGEYFRWRALPYYQEIYREAAKYAVRGQACASVFAELVARNGCQLHFDDYGEYVGGWSPELTSIFRREVSSGKYAVIVWNEDDLATEFPNYRLVPMSEPLPERFFKVYLYVRK